MLSGPERAYEEYFRATNERGEGKGLSFFLGQTEGLLLR